jgi:aerobic C4-dicarboxylate transport protein
VLSGQEPFDEQTMVAHHHGVAETPEQAVPAKA